MQKTIKQPSEEELKATAGSYHALGLSIIPFRLTQKGDEYEKQNLSSWKQWETKPQTDEDFMALNWNGANAFAIILGTQARNGLYLSVIDYDCKGNDVTNEVKEKGRTLLKEFPITCMEQTVNKGMHLIYWSRTKPKTIGAYHNTASLELLGEKKLCLMAPSLGYSKLNENNPTETDNIEQTFLLVLKNHGLLKDQTEQTTQPSHKRKPTLNKPRPCIIEALQLQLTGPNGHLMRLAVAAEYKRIGYSNQAIIDLFRNQADFDYSACSLQIESVDAVKTAKCESIEEYGYCLPNCTLKRDCADEKQRESQADRLVKLCLTQEVELFFDQHNIPYARVKIACDTCDNCGTSESLGGTQKQNSVNGSQTNVASPCIVAPEDTETSQIPQLRKTSQFKKVIMPIGGSQFKAWLAHLMWLEEEKAPGNDSLNSAINVLKGKAQQEGKQYTLYNRVAPAPDGIWFDMADSKWRAIKITSKDWEIVDNPPILFKRYSHQQPLIEPATSQEGNVWQLLEYTTIPIDDEKTRLAFMCTCLSYLIPLIPHPAIVASGPQGSTKSWLFRWVKRLIDPSSIELLSLPRSDRELAQQLEHHWIVPYDNLTHLPDWASDMLCRAVTGGGIAVRKLYSDDEDTILQFKRCVLLNGINVAAQRGDLLDRSTLIALAAISSEKRRTEEEIIQAFEKDLPKILAGFLNTLSRALMFYPTVKLEGYQRLADFSRYGCAIALALGKTREEFVSAYADKVKQQNEEALNADPVALALLKFCEKEVKGKSIVSLQGRTEEDCWKGQPSELYNKLSQYAPQIGIDTKAKGWPKTPNALTRRINDVSPALKAFGCEITSYPGTPRQIKIGASKLETEPRKQIVGITALQALTLLERCWKCERTTQLSFEVETTDSEKHNVCTDCAGDIRQELQEEAS